MTAATTDISVTAPMAVSARRPSSLWTFLAALWDAFSKAPRISHEIERLNRMSDAELGRLGLRREDIVRSVATRHGLI